MNCPNKGCQAEIPEDSVYCDQCGKHLGKCEKCGAIAVSKFCNKCGGMIKLLTVEPATPTEAVAPAAPAVPTAAAAPAVSAATSVFAAAGGETVAVLPDFLAEKKLTLVSSDGWSLDIANGDLLGRSQGPHAATLGAYPVISSRHGMISKQGSAWYYTDVGSSNGSYLNKTRLEKNTPAELHDNDELILANLVLAVTIR